MRILLVNPPTSRQPLPTEHVFPNGLLFVAAVLERVGHQVMMYDNNVDQRQPIDFVPFKPQLIGFSVLTGKSIECAIEQSMEFKERLPEVPVVWGGVHPTLLPEQTLSEPYIDYVVVGEGEYTALELVQHLETGVPPVEEIKGLYYKEGGRVVRNEPRPFIKNLDELPDPSWHLLDVPSYAKTFTLNTSRGCPFRCTFCYNQAFNRGRRSEFSAERIVAQIKHLQSRYGARTIKFYEDNFTINSKRLQEFCHRLIEEEIKIEWECEGRVHLKEKLLADMAHSGCYAMGIGAESGSQRMLDFLQKGTTVEQTERICRLMVKYGIGPRVYVMVALPTETLEDFNATLAMLKRLRFLSCEIMVYRPYPGTELYDYCVRNGLFTPPQKLADWVHFSELYDVENNLGQIPEEILLRELNKFKVRYLINPSLFELRTRPFKVLAKILNPYKAGRFLFRLSRAALARMGGRD